MSTARSLSPSRAADFLACPLAFRFRTLDRLPEPPSPQAARGSLVHRVLEGLFEAEPAARTPETARSLLGPAWAGLLADEPELAALPEVADTAAWVARCTPYVERWFGLEDPTRLQPAAREARVECALDSGLVLRGIVDRVDVAPDGSVRIVDYKTGSAPAVGFEHRALFQVRFYALVWWRLTGVVPRRVQLVYLGGEGETVAWDVEERDLEVTRRKVEAVGEALEHAERTGDWQPSPGRPCEWCAYRALCPVFGGTPPPLPPQPEPDPVSAEPGSAVPGAVEQAG